MFASMMSAITKRARPVCGHLRPLDGERYDDTNPDGQEFCAPPPAATKGKKTWCMLRAIVLANCPVLGYIAGPYKVCPVAFKNGLYGRERRIYILRSKLARNAHPRDRDEAFG
jgi:hypothetical protein